MPTNTTAKKKKSVIAQSKIRTISTVVWYTWQKKVKKRRNERKRVKERKSGENNQQKRQQQRFSCWNYVAIMNIVYIEMAVKSFFFFRTQHEKTRKCFSFTRLGIVFVFYFSWIFFALIPSVVRCACFVCRSMLAFTDGNNRVFAA